MPSGGNAASAAFWVLCSALHFGCKTNWLKGNIAKKAKNKKDNDISFVKTEYE